MKGSSETPRTHASPTHGAAELSLRPLSQFDVAPTSGCPVRYVERGYLLADTCPESELALLLCEALYDVWQATPRDTWALFRLGVFRDTASGHDGQPLATLEWQQWRAEAKFNCGPLQWSFEPWRGAALQQNQPRLQHDRQACSVDQGGARAARPERPLFTTLPLGSGAKRGPKPLRPATGEAADLMGKLFLELPELVAKADSLQGARFVLQLLEGLLPCESAALYLLDVKRRGFTAVAASGAGRHTTLLANVPAQDVLFNRTFEQRVARVVDAGVVDFPLGRLESRGIEVRELMLGPVQHGGRRRAMIELVNRNTGRFGEADQEALDYVCLEFARFLATHPAAFEVGRVEKAT